MQHAIALEILSNDLAKTLNRQGASRSSRSQYSVDLKSLFLQPLGSLADETGEQAIHPNQRSTKRQELFSKLGIIKDLWRKLLSKSTRPSGPGWLKAKSPGNVRHSWRKACLKDTHPAFAKLGEEAGATGTAADRTEGTMNPTAPRSTRQKDWEVIKSVA